MTNKSNTPKNNVFNLFPELDSEQLEHPIIGSFFNYFEPIIASKKDHQDESYRLRYQVYCDELGYEKVPRNGKEIDTYDKYSKILLIKHFPTQYYAGTVRIIHPAESEQLLSIESYYGKGLEELDIPCNTFDRNKICEISRIAISSLFRRRELDGHRGSETGVINQATYSEVEVRCFPLLAVGLYLSAAALCRLKGINHAYAMMEPELARSVQHIGIDCKQIGPYVNFHGKRAPFYINPNLLTSLSPAFLTLIKAIEAQLRQG